MIKKASKSKRDSETPVKSSAPVSLRVRRDHLQQLDRIADQKGTGRAAQIQTAIAEYIERNSK